MKEKVRERARARVPPLRRLPTVLLWSATRVVEAFLENEAWRPGQRVPSERGLYIICHDIYENNCTGQRDGSGL